MYLFPSKSCYANYKTGGLLSSYLSPFCSTSYYFSEGFKSFCFSYRFTIPPKSIIFQHPQLLHNFEGSKSLCLKTDRFGHNPMSDRRIPTLHRRNCERNCRNSERDCRNYERDRRNCERNCRNCERNRHNCERDRRNSERNRRNCEWDCRNSERNRRNCERNCRNCKRNCHNYERHRCNCER